MGLNTALTTMMTSYGSMMTFAVRRKGETMSDLISRQAAIDALERKKDKNAKGDIGGFYNNIIQNDIDTLNELSPAQPKTHEERAKTHACDLISRQAAINAFKQKLMELDALEWKLVGKAAIEIIEELPSVSGDGDMVKVIRCKDCKFWTKTDLKHTDGTDVYDCPYWSEDWGWANEEGFCSGAERKLYQPKEDA